MTSTMTDHTQRLALSELMHERSLPIRQVPARIRQWLILLDSPFDKAALDQWGQEKGAVGGRLLIESADSVSIWEAHGEFSTVTQIRTGQAAQAPIACSDLLAELPGSVFRSIEILVGERGEGEPVGDHYREDRLVCCDLFDGAARMWSDYTLNAEGTGFIRVQNIALRNDEPSRLVQTLIEVGNYRKMALLGFPVARNLLPWLADAEARHTEIIEQVARQGGDAGQLLPALLALSAEVEHRSADVCFRMGATLSYHRLTQDRLLALREKRLAGFSTAGEFIERRLMPAMRTCTVADRRLTDLGERISRTASLISLGQSVVLGQQNREILTNLNQRIHLQVRMQSLVEGLSAFAICYYAIGLAGYILGGFGEAIKHQWLAVATPIALALTWLALRRVRRQVHADLEDPVPES
jgi:uncharacterized membrane-anchored protein